LHNFGACGKVVHAVCKGPIALAHFSLAHASPIRDNPALSQSGGKQANISRGHRARASGAASTKRAQENPKANGKLPVTIFPQDIHTCGNSLDMDSLSNDDCYAHCEGTRNHRNVG
jgi:hypothetical protein